MAASFPGAIRPLSARVDLRDTVLAADVNALQEEVVAIEGALGTANDANKPLASVWSGSFAQTTSWGTISDRLANIESGLINGVGSSSIYATKASPTFTGTVTTPISVAGYVTSTSGGVLSSVATIPNIGLTNSYITINGANVSLGGSVTLAGDIESVSATSPLTGGGLSGALTIGIQDASTSQKGAVQLSDSTSTTSSVLAATPTAVKSAYDLAAAAVPKSVIDAKGDLLVGSANDALARVGVGTDGYLLTADSASTYGLKWAAAPVSLPTQSGGTTGQYLKSDGSSASWAVLTAGSTSVVGIVQLTDSTSSTSTTTAATPNSVKTAYDLAVTANAAAASGGFNAFLLAGM